MNNYQMDNYQYVDRFLRTVAEVLDLQKPIYEFSFEAAPVRPSKGVHEGAQSASLLEGGGWGGFEVDRWTDLANVPFADATAQTVLCLHVLEHLADPVRAIREMERILAPGGLLVVVGASAGCEAMAGQADDFADSRPLQFPAEEHSLWRWTPAGLARLLAFFPASLIAWRGPSSRPHTLYGLAKKAPVEQFFLERFVRLAQMLSKRFATSPTQKTKGPLGRWFRRLFGGGTWRRGRQSKDAETAGNQEEFSLVYTLPVTRESLQ